jgi:hypothetical protein
MLVEIDREGGWVSILIDTDPNEWWPVDHPNGSGKTGVDTMLKWHNDHPSDRTAGGWDIINQIAPETEAISRWQRLVRACNGPNATDQAKGLGLHE